MKIIDRYIIKLFLMNFLVLFIVVMSLFVLIDFISDMDVFLKAANANAKANQTWVIWETILAVVRYEIPMILLLYTFLSGLLINGAMAFTLSYLSKSREIVAIVSSGMSLYRVALPLILVGLLLAMINLPIQEYVLPKLANQLTSSKSKVLKQVDKKKTIVLSADTRGNLIHAARVMDDELGYRLESVMIFDYANSKKIKRVITAAQAVWNTDKKRWELSDAFATYPEANETLSSSPRIDDVEYFESDLSPKLIRSMDEAMYARLLSIDELSQLPATRSLNKMQIKQIIHGRLSVIVFNSLVFVIAMTYFLSREPRNMLAQGVKASAVTLVVWAGGMGCIQMGLIPNNPLASAWLAVIVLLPVTVLYWHTIKT